MSDPVEIRLDRIDNEDRWLNLLVLGDGLSLMRSNIDQNDGLLQRLLVSHENVQVFCGPIHGHVFDASTGTLVQFMVCIEGQLFVGSSLFSEILLETKIRAIKPLSFPTLIL